MKRIIAVAVMLLVGILSGCATVVPVPAPDTKEFAHYRNTIIERERNKGNFATSDEVSFPKQQSLLSNNLKEELAAGGANQVKIGEITYYDLRPMIKEMEKNPQKGFTYTFPENEVVTGKEINLEAPKLVTLFIHFLRKELADNGFRVVDDCKICIKLNIDFASGVILPKTLPITIIMARLREEFRGQEILVPPGGRATLVERSEYGQYKDHMLTSLAAYAAVHELKEASKKFMDTNKISMAQ